MDFIKKIHLGIQSLIHWALLKLLYKNRATMHAINSIRGKFHDLN